MSLTDKMITIIVCVVDTKLKANMQAGPGAAIKRVASEVLLGTGRELLIVHGGREYRLRLTQNGKLILTA
jgi:hemin uptake protein HemP